MNKKTISTKNKTNRVYQNIDFTQIEEKSFTDLPDTKPFVYMPLKKVGISNRPHYININDPFTGEPRELLADIKMLLNLKKDQKGLHISRMEMCLHELKKIKNLNLKQYAKKLVALLIQSQPNGTNYGRVEININYEREVSKNINRPSSELYALHLIYEEDVEKKESHTTIGITVPIINSCPCTQRGGIKDFYYFLKNKGINDKDINEIIENSPLQAHTNRGEAKLMMKSDKIKFNDIYKTLEKSSPVIRELLTGKDEHKFVRETHEKGFYCEDVAREIAMNVVDDYFNRLDEKTEIEIVCEIDESIHYHNLYAKIFTNLRDLKNEIYN